MGWFDCVASRYGCRVQGTTQVAFTVLDVLGYLDEIPVCVGYEVDGEVIRDFPTTNKLERAKPVLKVLLVGKLTSEVSRNMRTYRKIAVSTSNLLKKNLKCLLRLFLTVLQEKILY